MLVPQYVDRDLKAVDPRLFLAWNGEVGRFEVRLRMSEAELALEGLPPVEVDFTAPFNGGSLVVLKPVTVLIKRLQTAAEKFLYPGTAVVEYIRKMDTHRWANVESWLDHLDGLGREDMARAKERHKYYRTKELHAELEAKLRDRKFFT